MSLIPAALMEPLTCNGHHHGHDFTPLLKLDMWVVNGQSISWLVSELDPQNPNRAYGLGEKWNGEVTERYFDLAELERAADLFGLHIVADENFTPRHPLSVYRQAAREQGWLTDCVIHLHQAKLNLQNHQDTPASPS
jgi:hypothetical protein